MSNKFNFQAPYFHTEYFQFGKTESFVATGNNQQSSVVFQNSMSFWLKTLRAEDEIIDYNEDSKSKPFLIGSDRSRTERDWL